MPATPPSSRRKLRPVGQRRPAALVLGALLLGGVLFWGMANMGADTQDSQGGQAEMGARSQVARQLPLSSLSLPVSVPLSGIQAAVNARIPAEFARVDREQPVGVGVSVQVRGSVRRSGDIRILPTAGGAGGDTLQLEVPLSADFAVRPEVSRSPWLTGLENRLTRDFGGDAVVRLSIRPRLKPDWNLAADVRGELTWTDPLAIEVLGTRLSVAKLAEGAVREQMQRVVNEVARTITEAADVRGKVEGLWGQMQQPWPLPLGDAAGEIGVDAAYAQIMPHALTVAGFGIRDDALRLTLEAEGYLRAELGQPPVTPSGRAPLPALRFAPEASNEGSVHLRVPVFLPFEELSTMATRTVQAELLQLELPGGALAPTLRLRDMQVRGLDVNTTTPHLELTATMQLSALGASREVVSVISGRPWLRPDGRGLSLENVQVKTQRTGLSGWLVSALADARLEAHLAHSARFDLGPRLRKLENTLANHLPYSPVRGVWLGGELGQLRLDDLRVTGQGLEVTAAADGALDVRVRAEQLTARE